MAKYDKSIETVKRIIKYCDSTRDAQERFGNSYEAFKSDFDYQACCSMYLFQIGELSIHISDEVKQKSPCVPWKLIRGMRNIFAHDYEAVKTDRLWDTIINSIPELRTELMSFLEACGQAYNSAEEEDELVNDD